MNARDDERLHDLLADLATGGLSPAKEAELDTLLGAAADAEKEAWELAAAAADLALGDASAEPIPEALRQRVSADARRHFGRPDAGATPEPTVSRPRERIIDGWLVAAAAIILALWAWMRDPGAADPSLSSPAALRNALMATATDVIQVEWSPLEEHLPGIQGDVVWSTERQEGYMRLTGLPVNDPTSRQYQLWIVDPSRDDEPVDGGVFDFAAGGEQIIPIDAKLAVGNPAVFALTLEKPGGVVVSAGPLLAAAAVEG